MSSIPNGTSADGGNGGPDTHEPSATATDRIAEKAHRTIEGAAANAAEAEREIRRAAAEAASRVRQHEAELAEVLEQNLSKVRQFIEKNPIQSAGIAFVAGLVLSSLLRR